MQVQLINNSRPAHHRKSQSLLPTLSLSQLQKNYHALRSRQHHPKIISQQPIQNQFLQNQILVNSPFYDKTKCSAKVNCKCQFHKKLKSQPHQTFPFRKKNNISLKSIPRLKTSADHHSIQNKTITHKRFNSLANQTDGLKRKTIQYYENLIQKNQTLYQEFLKKLEIQKKSNLDCYNQKFEQFLKSHDKWLLHDIKQTKTLKNTSNEQSGTKNRFRTSPSIPKSLQNQLQSSQNYKDKYLKLNLQDYRRNIRKKHKKNTDYSFNSDDQSKSHKSRRFMSCIIHLNNQERNILEDFLQNACKDIGLNYSELKTKNAENTNFFTTICKNLIDCDQNIVQKAKSVLKRMSRLPIDLYSAVLKEINSQINNYTTKSQQIQKAVGKAFHIIQDSLDSMIQTKQQTKGRQKKSILGKLKNQFIRRASLNYSFDFQSKNKIRPSNSHSNNYKQKENYKISKFAQQNNKSQLSQCNQTPNSSETDQCTHQSDEKNSQNMFRQKHKRQGHPQKQRAKQLKKGVNLKKLKKNHIMKIIDEEIEFNSKKLFMPKKINFQVEDLYQKQRNQSQNKLRNEQHRKHLEFLKLMKEKQNERQSSTLSECEMKKNNTRAHYQRHKIFLKKIEISLKNNQRLKQMIINYEDDIFTKKRKVRILKTVIQHQQASKQSQFFKDLQKYIDIYEKNCNMVISKNNLSRFRKYARKKDDEFFDNQYMQIEDSSVPIQMENLIHMLKTVNGLKFYDLGQVRFEEEEYFSLVKQIPCFSSERIKKDIVQRKVIVFKRQQGQFLNQLRSEVLAQRGFDSKMSQVETRRLQSEELEGEGSEIGLEQTQSRQLRRIRERFNRNMEKYQRIFKTETSFYGS